MVGQGYRKAAVTEFGGLSKNRKGVYFEASIANEPVEPYRCNSVVIAGADIMGSKERYAGEKGGKLALSKKQKYFKALKIKGCL